MHCKRYEANVNKSKPTDQTKQEEKNAPEESSSSNTSGSYINGSRKKNKTNAKRLNQSEQIEKHVRCYAQIEEKKKTHTHKRNYNNENKQHQSELI